MSSVEKRAKTSGDSPPPKRKKSSSRSFRTAIPNPELESAPDTILRTNTIRSKAKRTEMEEDKARVRAQKYRDFVQVIRMPFTLDSLKKPLKKAEKEKLEDICDNELGPGQDAQCISAKFVDENGEPILFYFGKRIVEKEGQKKPGEIEQIDQYKNRTQAYWDSVEESSTVLKIFDGLHHRKCEAYHMATQILARNLHPHRCNSTSSRYDEDEVMAYTVDGQNGEPEKEDAGVLHLVHGWIQQGQENKGLYISSDISRTSTTMGSTRVYFHDTKDIALALAIMFEAAFPKIYAEYKEAFEAGVWFEDDPGPFLARAIVYKLQSKLHKDRQDVGPSACFPVGYFEGGEMLFPQLKTKLSYEPGAVCIFYSSILYHKVAQFYPKPQTLIQKEKSITPGRIGTVFFFPQPSYDILKEKEKGWGGRTNFGKNGLT